MEVVAWVSKKTSETKTNENKQRSKTNEKYTFSSFCSLPKVVTSYISTRSLDWRPLFDSGGMPSSHSSLCMGVTTAVAVLHGLGSSVFAICLGFSCIVMYDAANVRLQVCVRV